MITGIRRAVRGNEVLVFSIVGQRCCGWFPSNDVWIEFYPMANGMLLLISIQWHVTWILSNGVEIDFVIVIYFRQIPYTQFPKFHHKKDSGPMKHYALPGGRSRSKLSRRSNSLYLYVHNGNTKFCIPSYQHYLFLSKCYPHSYLSTCYSPILLKLFVTTKRSCCTSHHDFLLGWKK